MKLIRQWNRFWFEPSETLTIGVLRALFGFIILCVAILLLPYAETWFGPNGLISLPAIQAYEGQEWHFSFLFWCPTMSGVYAVLAVLILAAVGMMLGLYTRLSCILCWLCLLSLDHRDLLMLNSGDTALKLFTFYLCLAPAGASFSLDKVRRRRVFALSQKGTGARPASTDSQHKPGLTDSLKTLFIYGPTGALEAPWAQRLIQIQICTVYCSTLFAKAPGPHWHNGTGLWYVLNLAELTRFPMLPFMYRNFFINVLTWGALIAELAMALLVWFGPTRLLALLMGVLLHLGIEYAMNVPFFATVMITSYVAFLNLTQLKGRFLTYPFGGRIARRYYMLSRRIFQTGEEDDITREYSVSTAAGNGAGG